MISIAGRGPTWSDRKRAVLGSVVLALMMGVSVNSETHAQGPADPYAPSNGRVEGDRWVPSERRDDTIRPPSSLPPETRYERSEPRYAPEVEQAEPRLERYSPDGRLDPPSRRADTAPYRERRDPAPRRYNDRERDQSYGRAYREPAPRRGAPKRRVERDTYETDELLSAGHRFFGSISRGLARAIESVVSRSGRPNGYILGEDAGGAFVAGLRYGEGRLFTKRFGDRKVYWQGPTLGYDFGGEGSKVMVLVYNLRRPSDIYRRFGGVQGSAYLVGGVSVQFQKNEDITLAPIRAGVGLRLGANLGYLKYTRRPTWNPF